MWEHRLSIKIFAIPVLTLLFAMLFMRATYAYDALYTNPDTGYSAYIVDDEDLLTDEEEESLLNDHMIGITEYGGASFYTTSSSDVEKTTRDLCYALFNNDSGTTLCIDMGDRKISVQSSGAIYKRINKAYGSTITDNIYKYASSEDYYGCAAEGFDEIYTLLEGGRIAQPMRYISNFFMAIVFALIINFLYVWISKGKVTVDNEVLIAAAAGAVVGTVVGKNLVSSHKTRHTSNSSGGGHGGGGGGGGFSGGGGSHSF